MAKHAALTAGPLPTYPMSNIQLYERMNDRSWAAEDLKRAVAAYDIICRNFAGMHRPDGRIFALHLIRTSGILLDDDADPITVLAALLHSAYTHGDWGVGDTIERRRGIVRAAVGENVEHVIFAYGSFRYSSEAIDGLIARVADNGGDAGLSPIERQIVQIRLANELEEALDNALWYCTPDTRQDSLKKLELSAQLAGALGFAALNAALRSTFERYALTVDVGPRPFASVSHHPGSYQLLSPSAVMRKPPLVARVKGRLKRLRADLKSAR